LLVIANFSSEEPLFKLPGDIQYETKNLLIGNYKINENEDEDLSSIPLKPSKIKQKVLFLNRASLLLSYS
jgi:oligo-1,6-glucosidase